MLIFLVLFIIILLSNISCGHILFCSGFSLPHIYLPDKFTTLVSLLCTDPQTAHSRPSFCTSSDQNCLCCTWILRTRSLLLQLQLLKAASKGRSAGVLAGWSDLQSFGSPHPLPGAHRCYDQRYREIASSLNKRILTNTR